jgi:PhnB protein
MTRGPTEASFKCSIAPWLSVRKSAQAVEFYKSAFGATEVYRLDGGEKGVVARLSIDGAEFWLSEESPEHGNFSPESASGSSVRMILTVADPDEVFARARNAGVSEIFSRKRRARLADRTRGRSFRPSLGNWASACGLR